ncbi:MAG: DUF1566 domain-containing protein [Nitrospirae bacterium]|uniref:Lcl domain-containing protein n=1 Tax=Candidatus Magnetobacterium casense TaxID=1455061 RepID=UPI000696FCA9|nr:DUF1566 domain-containing protein [Candidatus Magnetobacterium casensis]MBF0337947.1 DUF1566 domain-containing protein [Nitrospirota bacterium]
MVEKNNNRKMKHLRLYDIADIVWLFALALIVVIGGMCFGSAAHAGTVSLPKTGQTKSYVAGDDGALQKGVAWPSPRFTDNGDKTITDNLTGLVWTKDADTPTVGSCTGGSNTWQAALDYVACLNTANYLGHNDWRLPNINELESLVNVQTTYSLAVWLNSEGFTNVSLLNYWSSTTHSVGTSDALAVGMFDGGYTTIKKSDKNFIWPVRSGQSGAFGNAAIWQTGQTKSYATGDDGDLKKGVVWPSPRFTDNDNGTVMDNLTGLVWTKDVGTPTVGSCSGTDKLWKAALDYVKCLNTAAYLGYSDWRLPNKKELLSLIDRENYAPTLIANHPFVNVKNTDYWSSTTYADSTSNAWVIGMGFGGAGYTGKSDFTQGIWLVRSGGSGGGSGKKVKHDFNGDGKADVLWRNTKTGDVAIWLMDGAKMNGGGFIARGMAADWGVKAIGDFNGDGKADALWQNTSTGDVYIWIIDGTTIKTGGFAVRGMSGEWEVTTLGDFNGDGKTDIMWRNTNSGDIYVWFLDATTINGGDYLIRGMMSEWVVKAVVDFNGDGKTDVLWQNTKTGDVAMWLMDGLNMSTGNHVVKAIPDNWQIKAVDDFNGDGKADIIWQDTTNGDVYMYVMDGKNITDDGHVALGLGTDWQPK